jgi:hypothetical protein
MGLSGNRTLACRRQQFVFAGARRSDQPAGADESRTKILTAASAVRTLPR